MPLTNPSFESLPYIDAPPTPSDLATAQSLITAELDASASTNPHPLLPPSPEPQFPPLILAEHERIAASLPLTAIDLTRYESLEAPSDASTSTYRTLLQKSYTAQYYLSDRHRHLSLLSQFGKNAWLTGNWQMEAILQGLERELAQVKEDIDVVNGERKGRQEEVAGELRGYEEGWKAGVGRVLEVEVASEGVRRDIDAVRRGEGR